MKNYNLTATQDWHYYFSEIFRNMKIGSILEFGLGVGTRYLLDHCEKLTSVELSKGDFNKSWYDKTCEELKEYSNWKCDYIDLPEDIKDADDMAQKFLFPLDDLSYLKSLKKVTDPYLKNKKYDIIFVDAGIHTRGDLVNLSFGKADIIAAHDTSRMSERVIQNIYGYNIVKVPDNYTEIYYGCTYMGTTLWIENSNLELIEHMENFRVL
jgi:hypothetical protein